jgi:aconitate hydratase
VGMGILPLQFLEGQTAESLGLTGKESFSIEGVAQLAPRTKMRVRAMAENGQEKSFEALVRVDTPEEVSYYRHGGILLYVLRQML